MGATKLYDSHSRTMVLQKLHEAIGTDPRVTGLLLVGSGAQGFTDEWSDLDFAAVVSDEHGALAVFRDWGSRVQKVIPVLWSFSDIRGPEAGLYALLLRDFLEVDISFQSLKTLSARSANWQVLFDRTGQVREIMERSWSEQATPNLEEQYLRRLDSIWHYVSHVSISVRRGHLWQAMHYLQEFRDRTIALEGLVSGVQTRHFREVDRLPKDRLAALEGTLPTCLGPDELVRALREATDCFFHVAGRLDDLFGKRHSRLLQEAMGEYLSLGVHRI